MARPRLSAANRRCVRLPAVRVTLAERAAIEGKARLAGVSAAAFLRAAVLGRHIAPRRTHIEDAVLVELCRIGNNINQLARAANSGRPPAGEALAVALNELRGVLAMLAGGAGHGA